MTILAGSSEVARRPALVRAARGPRGSADGRARLLGPPGHGVAVPGQLDQQAGAFRQGGRAGNGDSLAAALHLFVIAAVLDQPIQY